MKPRAEKKMQPAPAATSHARRPPSGASPKSEALGGIFSFPSSAAMIDSCFSLSYDVPDSDPIVVMLRWEVWS